MRQCECARDEMLGDFFCTDIKKNMEELCRDVDEEVDVDNVTKVNDVSEVNFEPMVTTKYEESSSDDFNEINVDEIPPKDDALFLSSSFSIPVIFFINYFILVWL